MKKLLLAFLCIFVLATVKLKPLSEMKVSSVTIQNPIQVTYGAVDMSVYGLDASQHVYREISVKEALRFFEEDGSGILFFAKPDGTNSMLAAQVLNEAAKELNVNVYYINTSGTFEKADYEKLQKDLTETFVSDATGKRSFAVPDAIAVHKGEIKAYHVALVDGVTVTSEGVTLTDVQRQELKDIYTDLIVQGADEVTQQQ